MTLHITAEPPIVTPDQPRLAKSPKHPNQPSPKLSKACEEVQREAAWGVPVRDTRMLDDQKQLEERLHRLEQEISQSRASSNPRSSAGRVDELPKTYRGTERGGRGEGGGESIEWNRE